jgi:hypothetical protein
LPLSSCACACAWADSLPNAGQQIASCTITAGNGDDAGATLEIFQVNGAAPTAPKTITGVFGKPGGKLLVPAMKTAFSPDGSTLEVDFGMLAATITRGTNTAATLQGLLAPAEQMQCSTTW